MQTSTRSAIVRLRQAAVARPALGEASPVAELPVAVRRRAGKAHHAVARRVLRRGVADQRRGAEGGERHSGRGLPQHALAVSEVEPLQHDGLALGVGQRHERPAVPQGAGVQVGQEGRGERVEADARVVVELDRARLHGAGLAVHAGDHAGRDPTAQVGAGGAAAGDDRVGEGAERGVVDRRGCQRGVRLLESLGERERLRHQRGRPERAGALEQLPPRQLGSPHGPEPNGRPRSMLRLMRRAIEGALAVLLAAAFAAPAQAAPVSPYDGRNPFACTLQQVGKTTDYPQPDADPFCVEFDKTHQNVTSLGIVDFLSKEPARVAAASDKCFYFQHDHWTGSVAQGQPPELWHWDGSYWFDKARGAGGVYVENFRIGGQSGDPTTVPGFPDEWKPYFSKGRGGVQPLGDVQAAPRCATRPNPHGPGGHGSGGGRRNADGSCRVPGGRIGRGIGGASLGSTRKRVRSDLGGAARERPRYATWCFDGGGRLVAGFRRRGAGGRVALLLTNAAPFDTEGIRVGTRSRVARKRLRRERAFGRVRGSSVVCTRERRRRLCAGLAHGHVRWLAIGQRKLSRRQTLVYLRGAART